MFGVLYYLVFASGKRQSWAQEEPSVTESEVHVNRPKAVVFQDSLTIVRSRRSSGSSDERQGLLRDNRRDNIQDLLTKSMHVERFDDDDEFTRSWYLATI